MWVDLSASVLRVAVVSSMAGGGSSLVGRLNERLDQGQRLLTALAAFSHIPGSDKLVRKVNAELRFLRKVEKKSQNLKEDHLRSSNMDSLTAITAMLESAADVSAILATFPAGAPQQRLVVDLVTDGGATWIKVIARSPRALQRLSLGQCEFGQRSTDQARQYLAAASRNRHCFLPPTVQFVFWAGVGCRLAQRLTALGVDVSGQRIDDDALVLVDDDASHCSDEDDLWRPAADTSETTQPAGLNLDVTAMLAYVSNLTNGGCELAFREPALAQQAQWERQTPVLPRLQALFADHRLVCCRSAHAAFTSIVNTVGGAAERRRAELLLQRVTLVEDASCAVTAALLQRGRVSSRAAAVFGTGEALRLPTVTANTGFVRAAAGQGVRLTALTHGSRALSEAKEPASAATEKGLPAGRWDSVEVSEPPTSVDGTLA